MAALGRMNRRELDAHGPVVAKGTVPSARGVVWVICTVTSTGTA